MNIVMETKPITDILNKFLAPFECVAYLGTDFCYMTTTNSIEYTFVIGEEDDSEFQKYCNSLFPEIKADTFLWSFLHELGHHETEDDFEEEEWYEYQRRISSGINNDEYFRLPIENAATTWAGEYILTHKAEIAEFWNELSSAIKTFYTNLKVEI